jgi:hypothetical protein
MNDKVKIQITETEWKELDELSRARIINLMRLGGYDTAAIEAIDMEVHGKPEDDHYNQFYGDEE